MISVNFFLALCFPTLVRRDTNRLLLDQRELLQICRGLGCAEVENCTLSRDGGGGEQWNLKDTLAISINRMKHVTFLKPLYVSACDLCIS